MADIYDKRRYGTMAFLAVAIALVTIFLYISNRIVRELASQERERMEIWADATKAIVAPETDNSDIALPGSADIDFLLRIIEGNRNIPVLLTDSDDNILLYRNFNLPEPVDTLHPYSISEKNSKYLNDKLASMKKTNNIIHITISPDNEQMLYYEDSRLLKMLNYFPYIMLVIMLLFITVVYYAVTSTKKAEQNRVWVGLSKETAHQLGTPISSLMAWIELLKSRDIDPTVTEEMDKDVNRLSTIASRFGKIGSRPAMTPVDVNTAVSNTTRYMAARISSRIALKVNLCQQPLIVSMSAPLLEWVMENLIKNAVDAMKADGVITVTTSRTPRYALISVSDTGKGITHNHFKKIFNPGYTTKKRGWGLGLTLAKRIVEQYHHGHIYVASSEPGKGTTFNIELPVSHPGDALL
ncbi:ATP-binding protein [uncultured Muribaculum sp.]|jgi:K+-sensing histidine kinase KdpD|uniref:sensor histidine kinase n=1 Tax=uncultured Muribaculum sp. TaxID=1918613 RepID=UPI00259D3122|nr:ATP-binding protein [uncultured Muribaculum sp.]